MYLPGRFLKSKIFYKTNSLISLNNYCTFECNIGPRCLKLMTKMFFQNYHLKNIHKKTLPESVTKLTFRMRDGISWQMSRVLKYPECSDLPDFCSSKILNGIKTKIFKTSRHCGAKFQFFFNQNFGSRETGFGLGTWWFGHLCS